MPHIGCMWTGAVRERIDIMEREAMSLNRWIRFLTQLGSLLYGKPTAQLIHWLWIGALIFLLIGLVYWFNAGSSHG